MRTVQDGATWRRRNYGTHLRRPATRARRDDGSISEIPAPASAMTADRFAIRTRMRDPGLVAAPSRSEERRVGKEGRARWAPEQVQKTIDGRRHGSRIGGSRGT